MQLRNGSWWAAWSACLGIILQATPAAAQSGAPAPANTPAPAPSPAVADVVLHDSGKLFGFVVDAQGLPMPATDVAVVQSNKVVARTSTDALGQFVVGELRGGVYQIAAAKGMTTVRAWEAATAPPVARPAALIVGNPAVIRGQRSFGSLVCSDALILAAIVAAAIAIPIAVSNSGDEDPPGS